MRMLVVVGIYTMRMLVVGIYTMHLALPYLGF